MLAIIIVSCLMLFNYEHLTIELLNRNHIIFFILITLIRNSEKQYLTLAVDQCCVSGHGVAKSV